MAEKITGYILIFIGIVIIAIAGFRILSIFKGNTQPINVISETTFSVNNPANGQNPLGSISILETLGLPRSNVYYVFNLLFELLFMGFLVKLGAHVASIGTSMVRPVYVNYKVKDKPDKPNPQ